MKAYCPGSPEQWQSQYLPAFAISPQYGSIASYGMKQMEYAQFASFDPIFMERKIPINFPNHNF